MLGTPRWEELGEVWGEKERQELVLYWHYLRGCSSLIEFAYSPETRIDLFFLQDGPTA